MAPPPAPAERPIGIAVNGIPPEEGGLLILPPSGFRIEVRTPDPVGAWSSVSVSARPWSDEPSVPIAGPARVTGREAVFLVERDAALAPVNHTLFATVDLADGTTEAASLDVAVREPTGPAPLARSQWIQLDFDVDRDADGLSDFSQDLAAFGLASGLAPSVELRTEAWVIDEVVARAQRFYGDASGSHAPGDAPLPVRFSAEPPDSGPFTRICVGGANPSEDSIIGNLMLDPGNANPADEACDDFLPSGVFPREIEYYAAEPTYQQAFGALIAAPLGSDPVDPRLLVPGAEPTDPDGRARLELLQRGVRTFAQVVASVAAHEAGHALGLVPEGPPGRGLFGGTDGDEFTHNLTPDGFVPGRSWLMNPGATFSFDDLAGTDGGSLPRIRPLNLAYLRGQLLVDARVDGLHPPPVLASSAPSLIETNGPLMAVLELRGSRFHPSAELVLRGPPDFAVAHAGVAPGVAGGPDRIVGTVIPATLPRAVYDVVVRNPDGQSSVLPAALEIR